MTATDDTATPLRGVVFDFDGVIADTEPLHLGAYQDVLADTSMTLETQDYYDRYLGYDDVGVFTALSRDQRVPLDDETLKRLIDAKGQRFDARVRGSSVLFPGAASCVSRLAEVLPLAIASGALHHEIEAILTSADLRRHFRAIVAADDVARSKPAPVIRTNVPSRCSDRMATLPGTSPSKTRSGASRLPTRLVSSASR